MSSHTVPLQCCNGAPAPGPIVEGWRCFRGLRKAAQVRIWALLRPALLEPPNQENKTRFEQFCEKYDVGPDETFAAVASCEYVLRRSSALDLSTESLAADLTALSGESSDQHEVLLSEYETAKAELRRIIVQETLADHGKVLLGLNWRLDEISGSDRGSGLGTSLVLLTLHYRDGDKADRISLQLTPDGLRELELFVKRFTAPVE